MSHAQNVELCRRARRIAQRVAPLPVGPAANELVAASFVQRCRQRDRHERTYREIFARLAQKVTA